MAVRTGTEEILDALPFGVALFGPDGVCLRVNEVLASVPPSAPALTGLPLEEVAARCFGPEYADELAADFRSVLADADARPRRECHGNDGLRYECAWQAWHGDGLAAILAVVDVTRYLEHRDVLEERARLAAFLTQIETTFGYTSDFDDILGVLVGEAPDGVGCEGAAAFVRSSDRWEARHLRSLPRALAGERFAVEEIPGAEDALTHRRVARGAGEGRWGEGEVVAVPLAASGEIAALLLLFGRKTSFSQPALEFAEKLSTMASFALENARLQAVERETREALQTALLGVVRDVPGVRFGHLYRSATRHAQVGGDFYELFELGEDRVGVIMGDVSGKGLSAASLAALTKTTVKIHARELGSPGAVLSKTNEVLVGECDGAAFVTVFYCVLDTASGELRYCGAGHPPPLVRRADGETTLLTATSPILGAYRDLEFEERVTAIENGDVLLLYTDGVTEARREGRLYGHERLLLLMSGMQSVNVRELPEIVFEDVFAYVRGDLGDDMAILALSPTRVDEGRRQQQLQL